MEKRLTESANSGIGSGNLYSAALQIWFVKEEESESGKLCGFLVNEEEGYEQEHMYPKPLELLYGDEEEEEEEEQEKKGKDEW